MSEFSDFQPMVSYDDNVEVFEVVKEEYMSTTQSSRNIDVPSKIPPDLPDNKTEGDNHDCLCAYETDDVAENEQKQEDIDILLQAKEETLTAEFQQRFDREVASLMERFDFILQNEQTRASYMLSEAHRERQEKIQALQTQLECKNLAGLMYVMCSERRKSKLEKMRLKEEYSGYVKALQDILNEGQELILNLSRGYKTAARVDHEWRTKMKNVMAEFQLFVSNFVGGAPEANQFFFDLPTLMKTTSPTVDNPNENPCDDEPDDPEFETDEHKTWWEKLDDADRPFVMFGDMSEFMPPQRREVLKHVKAAKTAPSKWKQYAFNNMFLNSNCSNTDDIKDEYTKHLPITKWECEEGQSSAKGTDNIQRSRVSVVSRRLTTTSMDVRGNMGSILKIISLAGLGQQIPKATLLGARDSMEIVSTTKLRDKIKHSDQSKVVINVGSKRTSIYEQLRDENLLKDDEFYDQPQQSKHQSHIINEEEPDESAYNFGSIPNDSLEVIQAHVPDRDHKINYEKVCPTEKCKRRKMGSFLGSLPHYMRASPFTHFEQTFEEYEACTPEQLAIIKQRLEDKKKKERVEIELPDESLLDEWTSLDGVGVQTSDVMILPPCNCDFDNGSDAGSHQRIFNMADLIPVKKILKKINKEFFFDQNVVFDRFKVVGRNESDNMIKQPKPQLKTSEANKIHAHLKQHPSLLDLFQANTQC